MKKKLLFIILMLFSFNTAHPGLFDKFKAWVDRLKEKRLPVAAQIGLKRTRTRALIESTARIKESIEEDYKKLVAELEEKEHTSIAEALTAAYPVTIEERWKKRLEVGKAVADKILQETNVEDYQMSYAQIKYDQAKTDNERALKFQKEAREFFGDYRKLAIQQEKIEKIEKEGKKAAEEIEEEEGKKAEEEIEEEEKKSAEEIEETKEEPEEIEELPEEVVMADETMLERFKSAWKELPAIIQKMKELDQKAVENRKQDIIDDLKPMFDEEQKIKAEYKKLDLRLKKAEKVPEDTLESFINRITQLRDDVDEIPEP